MGDREKDTDDIVGGGVLGGVRIRSGWVCVTFITKLRRLNVIIKMS